MKRLAIKLLLCHCFPLIIPVAEHVFASNWPDHSRKPVVEIDSPVVTDDSRVEHLWA